MPTRKTAKPTLPAPAKQDHRICFSIYYFTSEADAQRWAEAHRGSTYNGGYFDGMACGRDTTWDHKDRETGQQLYAVTD
jgi:hypothetical protein